MGVELVAKKFDKPIYVMTFPNNNENILILEQRGIIYLIEGNKKNKNPLLDIRDRVHTPMFPGDEMGLLGAAFHPNFTSNGYIYLNYVDEDDYTVISRFTYLNEKIDVNSDHIIFSGRQL